MDQFTLPRFQKKTHGVVQKCPKPLNLLFPEISRHIHPSSAPLYPHDIPNRPLKKNGSWLYRYILVYPQYIATPKNIDTNI